MSRGVNVLVLISAIRRPGSDVTAGADSEKRANPFQWRTYFHNSPLMSQTKKTGRPAQSPGYWSHGYSD